MATDGYSLDRCLEKVAYSTFDEARYVARKMAEKGVAAVIQPYRCHFNPGHFHVGKPHALKGRVP